MVLQFSGWNTHDSKFKEFASPVGFITGQSGEIAAMPKKNVQTLVVGLDIGTSKIVAIVGELKEDGTVEVVGIGSHPSRGLKRGVVVDIESTEQSIQRAIGEAELMSGCEINSVYAGITGNHIRSLNSRGVVGIKDREVSEGDVDRVLDSARAVNVSADQQIIHVLPQEYIIDEQDGIRQPIGMAGVRMEVLVHVVTAARAAVQNITKCVQRCGLVTDDLILQQLAASEAVLTRDEKDLGVCLVDIGAGTTDIAVFRQGAIRHTCCIPIAGDQATNDIAVALRTPTQHAEDIKIQYACALEQLTKADESIQVPSVGDRVSRRLARRTLAQVVEARYRELLSLVRDELRRSGFENMIPAGLVLTGGGAKMEGVVELSEEIFHMPVRLGAPRNVTGLSDVVNNHIYSSGVGLLLYGSKELSGFATVGKPPKTGSIMSAIKNWFDGNL